MCLHTLDILFVVAKEEISLKCDNCFLYATDNKHETVSYATVPRIKKNIVAPSIDLRKQLDCNLQLRN